MQTKFMQRGRVIENDEMKKTYFIRSKAVKSMYVHYFPILQSSKADDSAYVLKEGVVGACGFKHINAKCFVNLFDAGNIVIAGHTKDNLEIISMYDAIINKK